MPGAPTGEMDAAFMSRIQAVGAKVGDPMLIMTLTAHANATSIGAATPEQKQMMVELLDKLEGV